MSKQPRASVGTRMGQPSATLPPRETDNSVFGAERQQQTVEDLRLREIMPNRAQPRQQFDAETLQELAESIRQHGVIEPIIVRKIELTHWDGAGRRYELLAGERRWRASALAERDTIPAIVRTDSPDDRKMLELAIIENVQREDLHPLDEARAFEQMRVQFEYSYAQIAERIGKSKGYVQNRLRLLQMPEDVQQLVADRPDTLTHVVALARIIDLAERAALITELRENNVSYAALRARVQQILAPATADPMLTTDETYVRTYDLASSQAGSAPSNSAASIDESYLRKYDLAPTLADSTDESYLRKYDLAPKQEENTFLTRQERTRVASLTERVTLLLDDLTPLSSEDWEVLGPLALRLSDLLRKVGQAHAQQRRDE